MHLVDASRSAGLMELIREMDPFSTPGGSVANALAGAVSLGGRALFMGAIGDDDYGRTYDRLIQEIGIRSSLRPLPIQQGSCTVMVTADGERTMATHLGAAIEFQEAHLDLSALKDTAVLHIEGYQLDSPNQTGAILRAMRVAREHGARVSVDLADTWLIQRHRETLEGIIDDYVDILFSNETEAEELTGKEPMEALHEIAGRCEIAVVKVGEGGSLVMSGDEFHTIDPVPVEVVNTNGAGDTYAGAFLQSFVDGRGLETSGRIASYLAAQVVAREGARVEEDYSRDILDRIRRIQGRET
jgi:sugar/nucleoside kinase (ribokinase family)